MDSLLIFWSDRSRISGKTNDIINNLINNFKIIKIYILSFLTKNIQVKHIYIYIYNFKKQCEFSFHVFNLGNKSNKIQR